MDHEGICELEKMKQAVFIQPVNIQATSGRFVKNWAYLLTSSVFCQILGMIAMIRVARVLAPAGYGYFNLIQTTAGIGMVIAGLGMRNVIIRDCARYPDRTRVLYSASLLIRSGIGIIVALGIILYAKLSPNALPSSLGGFAVVILFGQILWDTTESISFGRQRMEYSSWINTLGSVLWVLWIWFAPASILNIVIVSLSFTSLQLFKAIIFGWQVKQIIPPSHSSDKTNSQKESRRLMIDSLPFYWLALLTMASSQLPILILAERSNSEQVGFFNVGFRLLNPLQLLIMTGLSVLYPYLSQAKIRDPVQYMQAIEKALKMTIIIGSGSAFLISLLRKEVVEILFGAKYADSAAAMAYQCWYTVLYAILCLIGTSLGASDKQRWLAALSTVYTVVALPIIWFGSAHGAKGLAAAMLIGAALNMTYHWYIFQKSLPGRFPSRFVVRSFVILSCSALCSWLISEKIHMIIKILISCIILIAMLSIVMKEWKNLNKPLRV
jgi:O-antigen/teichoic acid export membrane protein